MHVGKKITGILLPLHTIMNLHFLFIGGPELFIVILIVVMLFGADKIPEIARGLGKGMRQVKDATNSIKQEIKSTAKEADSETAFVKDINKEITQVKDDIDSFTGPIKRGL